MNGLAHAYRFLDADPVFVVGTSLPDWLAMVDRRGRIRQERAEEFLRDRHRSLRSLAAGVVQHHRDDQRFHSSPAFAELLYGFTDQLRDLLSGDRRMRPNFVAHITIEMLLDASIAERRPGVLERYYAIVSGQSATRLQADVNAITGGRSVALLQFIPRFMRERYLADYARNAGVAYRVNRILRQVNLEPLPPAFVEWVQAARAVVRDRAEQLLSAVVAADPAEWDAGDFAEYSINS